MKINKCNKLVCNLYNRNNYVVHIRALKQALNHWLILRKVHSIIKFYREPWLKKYIDMDTKLRTEAENDFEKEFFKLVNNSVFGKNNGKCEETRDIKLITTDKRRIQWLSEPTYHTTKWLSENLSAVKMKKQK